MDWLEVAVPSAAERHELLMQESREVCERAARAVARAKRIRSEWYWITNDDPAEV